jgi:serine/threonine protein kinase
MTTDNIQVLKKRGILRPRDVNRRMSVKRDEKTSLAKPQSLLVVKPPSPASTVNNNDNEEQVDDERTAEEKFLEVTDSRVPEDPTGDLAEMGIQEWSVDDFEYISTLGSGATATVYRASEKTSGYHVALKVQEYDDQDISSDVELDIHGELNHPNTVKMIDYFFSYVPFGDLDATKAGEEETDDDYDSGSDSEKQYLYIILEVCEKGSLFDVLECYDGGCLDECDAARYFEGCLQAMKYLHEKEFVHCDVKTANFLVDSNDEVKLADFGMTVRLDELEILGGSPVFMAPEHLHAWSSGGDKFDQRVDIYGLGVTLFQMLVGDFPFYLIEKDEDNKNADSLLACFGKLTLGDGPVGFDPKRLDLRILDDKTGDNPLVMPPLSFPDRMSEEAQDLISRLMEPNPEDRISLVDALAHEWFHCHV